MGILQNLSELVVAKHSSDLYKIYQDDKVCELPFVRQIRHFGFTFSECSGTILENWKLPLVLYYPVMNANDPTKQDADTDIGILALASRITAMQHNKECYGEIELFSKEIANSVSADMDAISNAITFADIETTKVAMLIH